MAPMSTWVADTPGADEEFADPVVAVEDVAAARVVAVVDEEDEHPAVATAIPTANAPGPTHLHRRSPMGAHSPCRSSRCGTGSS
jgi:hypothetical protein